VSSVQRMNAPKEKKDRFQDLTMSYAKEELAKTTSGGYTSDKDVVILQLSGMLKDGTPIVGEDVVQLKEVPDADFREKPPREIIKPPKKS